VTAAAERGDKITATYIPPPPPAPGKFLVRAPLDNRGHPIFPDLHLTPEQLEELMDAANGAMNVYLESMPE
jgi:hypothetical protein